MAEKRRYKKYKFIKNEQKIAFNQNQSLDTVNEESNRIIMPTNISQTTNDLVISDLDQRFDLQMINNRNEGQLTLINRQYIELKYEMKQIFNKLEGIERLLNNIAVNTDNTSQNILCHGEERSFLDKLPLKSVEAVTNFDTTIAESSEKFNSLVQLLYLVGGDTNNKIIYNMMNRLISNQAATFYSGQGKKKKLPFINLKLYDAVTVATRRRQVSITDVEIKTIVSLFLATAKSRIRT